MDNFALLSEVLQNVFVRNIIRLTQNQTLSTSCDVTFKRSVTMGFLTTSVLYDCVMLPKRLKERNLKIESKNKFSICPNSLISDPEFRNKVQFWLERISCAYLAKEE